MSRVFGSTSSDNVTCQDLTVNNRAVFKGTVDISAVFVGETMLDGTLEGTTDLATGHTFDGTMENQGEIIAKNDAPGGVSTLNANAGFAGGTGIPELLLTRLNTTYGTDAFNDWRIRNELSTLKIETAENTGNFSYTALTLTPDPASSNSVLNSNIDVSGTVDATGDLQAGGDLNVSGDVVVDGNMTVSGGITGDVNLSGITITNPTISGETHFTGAVKTNFVDSDNYGAFRFLTAGGQDLYFGDSDPSDDLYAYQINGNVANTTGDFGLNIRAKSDISTFEDVASFFSTQDTGDFAGVGGLQVDALLKTNDFICVSDAVVSGEIDASGYRGNIIHREDNEFTGVETNLTINFTTGGTATGDTYKNGFRTVFVDVDSGTPEIFLKIYDGFTEPWQDIIYFDISEYASSGPSLKIQSYSDEALTVGSTNLMLGQNGSPESQIVVSLSASAPSRYVYKIKFFPKHPDYPGSRPLILIEQPQ